MARIKFTALVDSIQGSIQGTTFQRNAYGYTIKGKPNMVRPNRILQNNRKFTFQAITRAWRQLDQADRDAWIAWATTNPVPARLNPDSYLNGFNQFVRYHAYLWLYDPGTILNDPTGTPDSPSSFSLEIQNDSGDLILVPGVTWTAFTFTMLLYLTNTQGVGQKWVKDTPIFFINFTNVVPASYDITDAYVAKFGQVPAIGSYLGTRAVFLMNSVGVVIETPVVRTEVVAP